MNALKKNKTWEITSFPARKQSVGCKWIFTVKHKADGSIDHYKARLVAEGFTQIYGIDYQETFAPVAKFNTVRVLLSLATYSDWPLHQLDVKNGFLNGDLEEKVFMEVPPSFDLLGMKNQVCKLRKSLYGLKQSPRAWFERFTKIVSKHAFSQGQANQIVFVKHSLDGRITILIVYVDDIILIGDFGEEIANLKGFLAIDFEIKTSET